MATNQDQDGNLVIKIDGALSAYQVSELKEEILTGLNTHKGLVLDVGDVTECDTLGVQLLYSAGKTAGRQNKTFLLSGTSDACRDAALKIGLELDNYLNSLKEA